MNGTQSQCEVGKRLIALGKILLETERSADEKMEVARELHQLEQQITPPWNGPSETVSVPL